MKPLVFFFPLSIQATDFGQSFTIPKLPSSHQLGFNPGDEIDITFVQIYPGNPKSVITVQKDGAHMGLAPGSGGVTMRTVQSSNLGAWCFEMYVDEKLPGVTAAAYTLNVDAKSPCLGCSQDGNSDEVDIELWGDSSKFHTNVFIQGYSGAGKHSHSFNVETGKAHVYCSTNDGHILRWFLDGQEMASGGMQAPFLQHNRMTLTQERYFWFSLWDCRFLAAGDFCPGNLDLSVPYKNLTVSAFSFYHIGREGIVPGAKRTTIMKGSPTNLGWKLILAFFLILLAILGAI